MNLFVKLFLWFLTAIALMVMVVIFLTWTAETQPVVLRWQLSTMNQTKIFAATAKQILERQGESGLRDFLSTVQSVETIEEAGIAGRNGEISYLKAAAGETIPRLIEKSFASGQVETEFNHPRAVFAAKSFRLENGDEYVLFVQWGRPAPAPFWGEVNYRFIRLFGLILTALAVCYLFARYLSAPIVKLSEATKQLAAGNLQTRVAPDIGRRKDEIGKLAKDFDEMAERIEMLITSQKRLTRDISHELRSPLARMNVALELAKQKANIETKPLLERIENDASRINEMVEQILTFSKLKSRAEKIEKAEINLTELIEETAEDAHFEAENNGKAVKILRAVDCRVFGDENLLRSAIENVLRNAVQYTKEGTAVEVSLGNGSGKASISIRDYGAGVPDEHLKEIFRPFFRVCEARERKTGGIGLGLAITKQAVHAHGGQINARNSENGGGLIIEIELPCFGQNEN